MSPRNVAVKAIKDWPYSLDGVKVKVLQRDEEAMIPEDLARDGVGTGHLEPLKGKDAKAVEKDAQADENKAEKPDEKSDENKSAGKK